MALTGLRAGAEGWQADTGVIALLENASAQIDRMWHVALSEGTDHSALHLGEASQCIHRALLALGSLRHDSDG